ncbi:hypothetical protein HNW77_13520 [Komagataeibacter sp. AV436]|uniref:Uncharacterized protein n=1 Tax=Komagataeibacter melomenusus TaxID=2766578 RepID=A0ABX2AHX5_9PROT|nr:hypothetical protein [Komagataeibacter melomenusus]MBV1829811.1 hypothetical protein [Komagataeibacter melomenusus]NPC67385.1 hypothetical protein [Komagataeibacter melomenusus]
MMPHLVPGHAGPPAGCNDAVNMTPFPWSSMVAVLAVLPGMGNSPDKARARSPIAGMALLDGSVFVKFHITFAMVQIKDKPYA